MTGARLWRIVRRVWITLGLTATAVFTVWSLIAYRASDAARDAMRSDDPRIMVREVPGARRFVPASGTRGDVGLLFVAGSLVEPAAYAPIARATAEAGFVAYVVELPRRGAFGGAEDPALFDRARTLMRDPSGPRRWVIGGHSRGAVVAVQLAHERAAGIDGLVLVGTSHPRDVDLSALTVPVTKIVGTRDGLASREEVEANRSRLPTATRWVWIEGGNHSQFGWYGFQPGDRPARIAASVQRATMLAAIVDLLRRVAASPDEASRGSDSSSFDGARRGVQDRAPSPGDPP